MLVLVLRSSLEIALILTIILLTLKKSDLVRYKTAVWLGVVAAGLLAIGVTYYADFFGDREIFEGYWSLSAAGVEGLMIGWLWWQLRKDIRVKSCPLPGTLLFLATCLLTLGKAIEIVLFPSTVFAMTSNFLSTDMVLKLTAAVLGILISFLFIATLLRLEARISKKGLFIFGSAIFTVMILRQLIMVLQIAFATGLLPLTTWAVTIIAPLINNYYPIFFYLLIGLTGLLWIVVRQQLKLNFPQLEAVKNPATRRKVMAGHIQEKRWVVALAAVLFTIITAFGTNAVLAKQGPKIEPPEPLTATEGLIRIPANKINDGKLHRFSYTTTDNVEIRFIVIQKGERIYGTAFDACDICGVAGYYQRGKEVICKNCDVVMNIPTIGFPGGCNPIPLKSKFDGKQLVIEVVEIETKEDMFKE